MIHSSNAPWLLALLLAVIVGACSTEVREPEDTQTRAARVSEVTGGEVEIAMVDPEMASREELLAIPGIDSQVVEALLTERPYADMREVDLVLGRHLNEQQRDSVYARLWKPIDLNTATAEEILLIPGVGQRMRREFEEYRPYGSMTQFRREIGKYVDDAEVARLERYVTIR